MTSEGLQPKISALLQGRAAQAGKQGAAAMVGRSGRRGPGPVRFYEVRENCGGVVKSWTEFAPINAGGGL